MPKSIKTPQVGSIVWYYANPGPAIPQAAIVTLTVDQTHFNLFVLSGVAVGSAVLGVLYTEGGGVAQSVTVAAVQAGGAGYAVNDLINLPNGVVLKVLTLSTTAVATAAIVNAGASQAGAPPANPVAQVSSSGAGTGATFNLTWSSGAWCTYQRIFESTATVMPGATDTGVAAMTAPKLAVKPDGEGENGEDETLPEDDDDGDDDGEGAGDQPHRSVTTSRPTARSRTAPPHSGRHR
jgi:hypothetical protein